MGRKVETVKTVKNGLVLAAFALAGCGTALPNLRQSQAETLETKDANGHVFYVEVVFSHGGYRISGDNIPYFLHDALACDTLVYKELGLNYLDANCDGHVDAMLTNGTLVQTNNLMVDKYYNSVLHMLRNDAAKKYWEHRWRGNEQ